MHLILVERNEANETEEDAFNLSWEKWREWNGRGCIYSSLSYIKILKWTMVISILFVIVSQSKLILDHMLDFDFLIKFRTNHHLSPNTWDISFFSFLFLFSSPLFHRVLIFSIHFFPIKTENQSCFWNLRSSIKITPLPLFFLFLSVLLKRNSYS
jgi:hypothetical protein